MQDYALESFIYYISYRYDNLCATFCSFAISLEHSLCVCTFMCVCVRLFSLPSPTHLFLFEKCPIENLPQVILLPKQILSQSETERQKFLKCMSRGLAESLSAFDYMQSTQCELPLAVSFLLALKPLGTWSHISHTPRKT